MTSGVVVGKRQDRVSKGMLTQSTAPKLARKRPVAGTNSRRFITGDQNSARIIGKMAKPPRQPMGGVTQPTPDAVREMLRKRPKVTPGVSNIRPGGRLKGDVAKFVFKPTMGSFKTGWQGGMGKQTNLTSPANKTLRGSQNLGFLAAKNRKPLAVGGAGVGAAGGMYAMSKRYGDPEDARYARLGAGSAALGIGGVAGLGYAAREGRDATKVARRGAPFAQHAGRKGKRPFVAMYEVDAEGKETKNLVKVKNQRLVHASDRLKSGGMAISRRGALAGVGGLAALGGANHLRGKASERRWN